ncbi:MAG: NAD+ synthase [Chlorobi bacterium]|nr:NAD+ synthase [Chlorobiota bacterium]
MRITIAQLNFHIGNFRSNLEKMKNAVDAARKEDSDLVIFSEMSVSGYPPLDLLERKEFIDQCQSAIRELLPVSHEIGIIAGTPTLNPLPEGKNLFNAACLLYNGEIAAVVHKTLLPTYDIFDEYRHFEPNKSFHVVPFKGEKIALTICEDLWDDQPLEQEFGKSRLYTISPMEELARDNPGFVINIAASPFAYNRIEAKKKVFIRKARKYHLPVLNVNQIGAQTELIFEGGSMIVDARGNIRHQLKYFDEDIYHFNLKDLTGTPGKEESKPGKDYVPMVYDALILGLHDFFGKMNFRKAVLGLSGGIDSAVSLAIAVKALGNKNVHAILMPSAFSSETSVTDAVELSETLKVSYDIIPINKMYDTFTKALDPYFKKKPFDVTEENIQARIRAVLLMAFANKFGYILLNTSNKSEAAVGYGTLYGDMAGGISVLGDVYKSDVYKLARYINREKIIIPENILNKPPSAELSPGQKDSDTLPDYSMLDQILYHYIELLTPVEKIIQKGYDKNTVLKTIRWVNQTEYKRYQAPPILRISSKAFGAGRRMPLVAKYDEPFKK